MGDYKEESIMEEHVVLDLVANAQIMIKGIQYGVFAQDIDTLRKAVADLKDIVHVMSEVVENDFGE